MDFELFDLANTQIVEDGGYDSEQTDRLTISGTKLAVIGVPYLYLMYRCHFRLDFESFDLDKPEIVEDGGYDCKQTDRLTISGTKLADTGVPYLCGYNTGQHSKPYQKVPYPHFS